MRWWRWCAVGLAAWLGAAAVAAARDITAQVLTETTLGRDLAEACRVYCLGNRSRATLQTVTVQRKSADMYAVFGRAALLNHQYMEPQVLFGAQVGGFDVFRFTVLVEGDGTLDARTCDLRVESIRVIDDRLRLTDIARREEGKIYRIADCQKFLVGL